MSSQSVRPSVTHPLPAVSGEQPGLISHCILMVGLGHPGVFKPVPVDLLRHRVLDLQTGSHRQAQSGGMARSTAAAAHCCRPALLPCARGSHLQWLQQPDRRLHALSDEVVEGLDMGGHQPLKLLRSMQPLCLSLQHLTRFAAWFLLWRCWWKDAAYSEKGLCRVLVVCRGERGGSSDDLWSATALCRRCWPQGTQDSGCLSRFVLSRLFSLRSWNWDCAVLLGPRGNDRTGTKPPSCLLRRSKFFFLHGDPVPDSAARLVAIHTI